MAVKEDGKKSIKSHVGKISVIIVIFAGLFLFLSGMCVKIYEMNSHSYFYINSTVNSFFGIDDISIVTGVILLVGTGLICLLRKIKNKTIKVISMVVVLVVFLVGEYFFLGLNGLATMWTELHEIQSPDGKRIAVVRISGFMDDVEEDVYIKANPIFLARVSNQEQEELHHFYDIYTKISWDHNGFTMGEPGRENYTYLYPVK